MMNSFRVVPLPGCSAVDGIIDQNRQKKLVAFLPVGDLLAFFACEKLDVIDGYGGAAILLADRSDCKSSSAGSRLGRVEPALILGKSSSDRP